MNEPSCKTCKFYSGMLHPQSHEMIMICRRRPPRVLGQFVPTSQGHPQLLASTQWPIVAASDWCGEYQLQIALS